MDDDDDDVIAALRQVHAVLADVDAGRPAMGDTLLAALAALRELRELIAVWEPRLITASRAAGVSWTQMAPALGVASRQAAERRYLRLQPTDTGEVTGEARVRAARDRRAGDRAVTQWARANAGRLRQLAGQIAGIAGLSPEGQRRVEDVNAALAADDTATLLDPLARVRTHLAAAGHPELADRITAMATDADHERRSTQVQRGSTSGE